LKETFSTLNDLVRIGKVHYVGVSNFNGSELQKAIDLCNYMGLNRKRSLFLRSHPQIIFFLNSAVVSLQPQYSLLCRSTEWELIPVAIEEGLAVLPWSPLVGMFYLPLQFFSYNNICYLPNVGGWLSGKYKRGEKHDEEKPAGPESGSRIEWAAKFGWQATNWQSNDNEHTWGVVRIPPSPSHRPI